MIMNELCVLVFMILCHLIDDYVLQGWLATGKQKDWWRQQENYTDKYTCKVNLLESKFKLKLGISPKICLLEQQNPTNVKYLVNINNKTKMRTDK